MEGDMQKKIRNKIATIIVAFVIGACSLSGSPEEVVDYLPTIEALDIQIEESLAENEELLTKNEDLASNNEDLESDIDTLNERIVEFEDIITDLEEEVDAKKREKALEKTKAINLYKLFTRDDGDDVGEFVLCGAAFETEFAYIDKLSMRTQLEEYNADATGVNIQSVSSQHQMIWSNSDDGLIKVYSGGYMYPFIVRFEDDDDWMQDAVYSLTSGCYVDFPELERLILKYYGEE